MKDGVKLILPDPADEHILATAKQLHRRYYAKRGEIAPRFRPAFWVPLVQEVFASLVELAAQEQSDVIHHCAIDHAARQQSRRHG